MNRKFVLTAMVAFSASQFAAQAGAQIPDADRSTPSVAADKDGNIHVVITPGLNGLIMKTTRLPNGMYARTEFIWVPKQYLTGPVKIAGSPATMVADDAGLHLFILSGTTNNILHNYRGFNTPWGQWEELPAGVATSLPRAVKQYEGLYVVARGADNSYYYSIGKDGNWSAWQQVPGSTNMTSGPAVTSTGDAVFIVGRGGNNGLWAIRGRNGRWGQWVDLKTTANSSFTTTGYGGLAEIAVRNADNTVQRIKVNTADPITVTSSERVIGSIAGTPVIGTGRNGSVLVVWGVNDNKLWYEEAAYSGFQNNWAAVNFAPSYIEDFKLSSTSGNSPDCPSGYEADASQDLNQGAGGKYIFLCTKYTNDPTKAVTGVKTLTANGAYDKNNSERRCGFGASGEIGQPVTDKNGNIVDLNGGAGGSFIYMCQGAPNPGSDFGGPFGPYSGYRWHVWHRRPLQGICDFGDGSRLAAHDIINKTGDVPADLNNGAGGAWVYLCLKNAN